MYLTEKIEDSEMVGFFEGISSMTKRLQRFGYCNVTTKCFGEEININAHEFHKSFVDLKEEKVYDVEKIQYDGEILKTLIDEFKFNISYISSQENGSEHQYFKMGLYIDDAEKISNFLTEAEKLCEVRIIDYNHAEKIYDNSIFYNSFVKELGKNIGLNEETKNKP